MYHCVRSLARPHKPLSSPVSRLSSTLPLFTDLPTLISPHHASQPSLPQVHLHERRYAELKDSLTHGASPSRVWAHYINLTSVLGYQKLPLQLHQEVLRRCTPSSKTLRVSALRRLMAGNKPSNPHIHEDRFQSIIRNIRAMDLQPHIKDYHFILEQFAAVGHHVGAIQVYKEMIHIGITPRTRTFGLCLQAIAHRLTLPVERRAKDYRSTQTRRMMADLIADMQKLQIPFTSANFDLTVRIMKESIDPGTFESIMKLGYGIDLSNPDRPPLEFSSPPPTDRTGDSVSDLPTPQSFSTAALNTTLDILGRLGNVSKLVQAFEVLTQPLPRANDHLFSSFDDDDDIGVADVPPVNTPLPPYTTPNTTSYNILLRHLSQAGETTLVRHYINQAISLELQTDQKLRIEIKNTHEARKVLEENTSGFESVPAPHFSLNRATLLPAFGGSNRNKDHNMMRWLSRKLNKIMRRKRECLSYFTVFRQRMDRRRERERNLRAKILRRQLAREARERRRAAASSTQVNARTVDTELNSAFVPSVPHQRFPSLLSRESRGSTLQQGSIFDVDLDAPPPSKPPAKEPAKSFDIDLHIRILERDIMEITAFQKHLEYVLGRTHQRIKERLGRRVWAGKDIYLTNEKTRRIVSKSEWRNQVNFRPRKHDIPDSTASARGANRRSFSPTFFQSNQLALPSSAPSSPASFSSPSRPR